MIIEECQQGTEEWMNLRKGIPTSSCFDKIVTTKGEPSKSAQNYMYQLAGERLAGVKTETYQNAAMLRGIEMQGEAVALFKFLKDVDVKEVGLCYRDEQKRYSCSPDGLMDLEGLEIKCPLIHTHVGYLLSGSLPMDYYQQVQGSMFVTGFPAWWFMSYYPGLPPMILRVERDDVFCAKLKVALDGFCDDLDKITDKLKAMA